MRHMDLLVLPLLLGASAQALASGAGASWLGYPSSARSLAEAGGLGVLAEGVDSVGLNPAGLADMGASTELEASYSQWPGDIGEQNALGAYRTGSGALGLRMSYIDFGQIQRYGFDNSGSLQALGSMHPSAMTLGLAYASRFGDLSLGGGADLVTQDITGQGSSNTGALEMGAKYSLSPSIVSALSLVNAGGSLDSSALPTAVRMGVAMQAAEGEAWGMGLEASVPLAGPKADILGAVHYHLAQPLTLRGGWRLQGEDGEALWSLGASFKLGLIGLDYAMRQVPGFSPVNHFSVRFEW